MKYFLGIDNGGTATKAALYDELGAEVAVASESTQMICVQAGFAERDMDDMWEMNRRIIRQVIRRAGIAAGEIAGVACCGHGKGLYLTDKAGRPVRNGILSADTRAAEYEKRWKADGTERAAYQRSLQHVMACQPVALLAWLKDHEPEVIGRIGWVLPCKDYIRYKLTGKAMAEMSDISGTGLLNLNTRDYDPELLRIFGIEFVQDALPPLCESTQCCGTISEAVAEETGLAPGTPVFGGMFDINACALAVGAVTTRDLCMISGTWSINEFVNDTPILSDDVQMNSLFCLDGKYLIEESSATSAGNNEWFLKKILRSEGEQGKSVYELANEKVASLPAGEPLPIFLPYVMASNVNPDAMGAFVGLTENMDQRHLIAGVYEGVAFSHRLHLSRLLKSRAEPVTEIRLSGGAARSEVWTQMFADIMGYPIRSAVSNETGALGCAISAATASGCKPSMETAIADMVRFSPLVEPNLEKKAYYDARYELFCRTIQALDGVWSGYRGQLERMGGRE